MKPVWIVDDDQSIRWVLEKALAGAGVPVRCFASADSMLEALKSSIPGVLVTDIRMPDMDGLTLLQEIRQRQPDVPVIVMTAFSDLASTVAAFRKGAFDYLAKPFDINDALALIRRASAAEPDTDPPDVRAAEAPAGPALLESSSMAMREVFRAIGRLSGSPATVLITGESGTGKELIARALHTHSVRASGPFVALNAAAIPRELLEAELFGHERGAFTGATHLRRGRFEEADSGTLFLDEIGDMPFDLQTRLLRVLAEGTFYRVGGTQAVSVNVRIVAATHQPLEELVTLGRFREDLFHRLNVIRLRLPPLRERKEDIPALARLFLRKSAHDLGVPVRHPTAAAMQALVAFDYPGNIRQLENFCHWLTVMSSGQRVDVKELPPEIIVAPVSDVVPSGAVIAPTAAQSTETAPTPGDESGGWKDLLAKEVQARLTRNEPAIMATLLREFENVLLVSALTHCRDRRAEAAQRLGIGRNTLTRKCQELGIG